MTSYDLDCQGFGGPPAGGSDGDGIRVGAKGSRAGDLGEVQKGQSVGTHYTCSGLRAHATSPVWP